MLHTVVQPHGQKFCEYHKREWNPWKWRQSAALHGMALSQQFRGSRNLTTLGRSWQQLANSLVVSQLGWPSVLAVEMRCCWRGSSYFLSPSELVFRISSSPSESVPTAFLCVNKYYSNSNTLSIVIVHTHCKLTVKIRAIVPQS